MEYFDHGTFPRRQMNSCGYWLFPIKSFKSERDKKRWLCTSFPQEVISYGIFSVMWPLTYRWHSRKSDIPINNLSWGICVLGKHRERRKEFLPGAKWFRLYLCYLHLNIIENNPLKKPCWKIMNRNNETVVGTLMVESQSLKEKQCCSCLIVTTFFSGCWKL